MIYFVDYDSSDLVKEEFDKNKKFLNPLSDSCPVFKMQIKQSKQDTCEWIFELDEYQNWRDSHVRNILSIKAESGK